MFLRAREALLSQRNAYHSALIPGTRQTEAQAAQNEQALRRGTGRCQMKNQLGPGHPEGTAHLLVPFRRLLTLSLASEDRGLRFSPDIMVLQIFRQCGLAVSIPDDISCTLRAKALATSTSTVFSDHLAIEIGCETTPRTDPVFDMLVV
jgi:hypothetical protein